MTARLDAVRDPTTWTIIRYDGPDYLGLRALQEKKKKTAGYKIKEREKRQAAKAAERKKTLVKAKMVNQVLAPAAANTDCNAPWWP